MAWSFAQRERGEIVLRMNDEWSCLLDPMRQFAAEPARMLMLRRLLQ